MKTRVFISKAISSIVNLDRYPNLLNEILDENLRIDLIKINNNDNYDNNFIHGLLQVLNTLTDKHNILNYISLQAILEKTQDLAAIKQ